MNRLAIIFFVALGLSFGFQEVRGQNTQNADLHPPYLAEEEPAVPEGEEGPVLEEGEGDGVTERGIRLRKFRKIPKQKKKVQRPFRLKRPPIVPPIEGAPPPSDPPYTPPNDSDPPPNYQCVVKTSDIAMNPHIDIGYENKQSSIWNPNDSSAQQSLMRMMSKGSLEERRAASGMVQAIKQGTLDGILRTDKQAVWARAGRLRPQKVPIHVIPAGQNAMCLKKPVGEPPMIIYRQIRMPPSVFDRLLVGAWSQCGLQTPDPPCEYVRDMGNKPELECYTNQQCVDKGLGNFCTTENICETRIDPIPPPDPVPPTACDDIENEITEIERRIAQHRVKLQEAEAEKKSLEQTLKEINRQIDLCHKDFRGQKGCRGGFGLWKAQVEQQMDKNRAKIGGIQLKINHEEMLLSFKKNELQICQSASQGAATGNGIQN